MRIPAGIAGLLLIVAGCHIGSEKQSLAQCPGNHNDDSLLVWQDAAMDMQGLYGVTGVGPHPTRDCISIGVRDSTHIEAVEIHLQELGIPRDAVVISASTE